MKYLITVGLCCIILSSISVTQAQPARLLLQRALAANGAWSQLASFEYTASRTDIIRWQSYSYRQPKGEQNLYELLYDMRNGHFMHHTVNHYSGGYVFNTFRVGLDSFFYVYGSRTGRQLLQLDRPVLQANRQNIFSNFPYFILAGWLQSKDPLLLDSANGQYIVRRVVQKNTLELRLNASSLVLEKNSRTGAAGTNMQCFSHYRYVEGCLIPAESKRYVNGELVLTDQLLHFHANGVAKGRIHLPDSLTLEKDNSESRKVSSIGKDVYLIEKVDGDRNIVFINMNDGILLTEAPVSPAVTQAILQLIHQTLPGRPIKYVHLSHFHNDHIAGISELVKEGVAIICTPVMETAVHDMLHDTLADTASVQYKPQMLFFTGDTLIADSRHHVQLYEVGNTHAEGMSFLYLPEEQLIAEGDLLSLPEDGTLSPAIDVSRSFYRFLQQRKISYKRIIGHHGLADIRPAMFDAIVRMKE